MARKNKDRKMAKYGRLGFAKLKSKMTEEQLRKHLSKIAKDRWKKHPEQRSEAHKAQLETVKKNG